MASYLVESGVASQVKVDAIAEEARQAVAEAIEYGKQAPEPSPDTLYEGLYSPEFIRARGIEL
jgi:pyruvate dehydrogenase E1 component alpha subunit